MLVMAFFKWWYGPGWQDAIGRILGHTRTIYLDFSVPILLRTLFAPWRRVVSDGNGPLTQRLRATLDNLVSRFVGLGVRLIALIAAGLLMALTVTGGALLALLWPLVPLAGVGLVIAGVVW
jgi:hypothetical protein